MRLDRARFERWVVYGLAAGFSIVASVGGCSRPGSSAVNYADVANLSAVVDKPLAVAGEPEVKPSDAECLAGLARAIGRADAIAGEGSELSAIAKDFADALRDLQAFVTTAPSLQPLVRSGLETWSGSRSNDDQAFMLGLLGVGAELSKLQEVTEKVAGIHSRMVACRLRLADVALRDGVTAGGGAAVATAKFVERGGLTTTPDTLFLTNSSDVPLTKVKVLMQLTGADGSTFSNCFFAERWEPGQVLLAVCESDRPFRETVHGVKRVRYRVVSAERSGPAAELTF